MRYRSYPSSSISPVWVLIGLNVLLYMATFVAPGLVYRFGLSPLTFLDRPWTILTNLFIHAGFGHVFGNMLTLYFFGTYLSSLVGNARFLIVYFGGGILGNILLLVLAPLFPFSVAVGASGAVFAVGGALTVLRPKQRVLVFPIPVPIPLWAAVIGGCFILSLLPFVAWQAHLGGLIFGLVAGYFFRRRAAYFR